MQIAGLEQLVILTRVTLVDRSEPIMPDLGAGSPALCLLVARSKGASLPGHMSNMRPRRGLRISLSANDVNTEGGTSLSK
jgi:hypothetical protein